MSAAIQSALYPLVCALSLALLPYQPEQDPRVITSDLFGADLVPSCPITT